MNIKSEKPDGSTAGAGCSAAGGPRYESSLGGKAHRCMVEKERA